MIEKVGVMFVLLIVSSVPICNSNTFAAEQTQEDWSSDIGEQLNIMNTITWTEYSGATESTTLMNGWSYLSAESHPDVGVLESWSDIPHPNETFSSTYLGFMGGAVFTDVYLSRNIFQGQNQSWFNFILPNRALSVFANLLDTLTQGPWNHSISPVYFEDESLPVPSFWGYHYSFSHEGFFYEVSVTYWISAGYYSDDHYSGVIREGWVKVYDESIGKEIHMRRIRCSPSGPEIGGQIFYHSGELVGMNNTGEYIEGETGNIINWHPLFLPTGFTGSYGIYMNGTVVVPEQTHTMSPHWTQLDTTSLNHSVDGLAPGVYNFTLVVKDLAQNTVTCSFMLTVNPYLYTNEIILGGVGILVLIGLGLYLFRRR